jgi:hypothetical protein
MHKTEIAKFTAVKHSWNLEAINLLLPAFIIELKAEFRLDVGGTTIVIIFMFVCWYAAMTLTTS